MLANLPNPASSPTNRRSQCGALTSLAVVLAVLCLPALARAQRGDVAITGSGSSDGENQAARTAVSASFELVRSEDAAPPTSENAEECCVFVFRGVARDTVNAFELELDAELAHSEGSDASSTDAFVSQAAALEVYGWRLGESLSYQSPTRFSDPFWRSSRGLAAATIEAAIPPMWAIGRPRRFLFWAGRLVGSYTELVTRDGSRLKTSGYDLDVALEGAGIQTGHTDIGLFNFRLREFGVPTSRVGNVVRGQSVAAFDFELVTLAINSGDLSITAAGGIGFRSALAPFRSVNTDGGVSSKSEGEPVTTPVLWLGASLAESESRPFALTLGGGAFARVSPDALGVDRGWRGEASATRTLGRDVELTLALDAASLTRRNVSALATAEDGVDPVGTHYLLATGEARVSLPLADDFHLQGRAYAERTDRQDARRHTSAPDPDVWGFGGELSVSYTFGRD